MEFSIVSINDNGSVDVRFSDGVLQNISNLTVSDVAVLNSELVKYGIAYAQGKDIEIFSTDIAPEVRDLEGKKVTFSKEEVSAILIGSDSAPAEVGLED